MGCPKFLEAHNPISQAGGQTASLCRGKPTWTSPCPSSIPSQLSIKANIWQKAECSIEGMTFFCCFFFCCGTVCGSHSICLQQVLQKVKANLCISAPLYLHFCLDGNKTETGQALSRNEVSKCLGYEPGKQNDLSSPSAGPCLAPFAKEEVRVEDSPFFLSCTLGAASLACRRAAPW